LKVTKSSDHTGAVLACAFSPWAFSVFSEKIQEREELTPTASVRKQARLLWNS